jgi:hypothetical protein
LMLLNIIISSLTFKQKQKSNKTKETTNLTIELHQSLLKRNDNMPPRKPPAANVRFIEWIEEWLEECKAKEHMTNMKFCLSKVVLKRDEYFWL